MGEYIRANWPSLWRIFQFVQDTWPLLLPVVLGFVAVYWLLPRVRQDWTLPGAVAGAAALVCGGWFLIYQEFAAVEAVLFYAFSAIAIMGAGLMLAQHNPVRAALSFALVVLSSCGLFLLLAAPFLMAATLIIYGGAIIITFLFVVMLAQQDGLTNADERSREPFLASLAGFVLLACLLVVLQRNYDVTRYELSTVDERFGPIQEKLHRALKTDNLQDLKLALKNSTGREHEPLELVTELQLLLPKEPEVTNIESAFHFPKTANPEAELRKQCEKVSKIVDEHVEHLRHLRHSVGGLQADPKLPLSSLSGIPANKPFPSGNKELLPARNVEALGTALFTEYLVAVEMAGVLLLVATIGAIVVVERRRPGQKPGETLR